ncbi:MAG: response regulator [Bacillota bacterium]
MSAGSSVIIVDKSRCMRNSLKAMISRHSCAIHEAGDEFGALRLALAHHPRIIFISMENNNYWPNLVQTLKKKINCPVVVYTTKITRDSMASAYFAGVDDILINPVNQAERVEKYILKGSGAGVKYC